MAKRSKLLRRPKIANVLSLFGVAVLTLGLVVGSYLNSKELNVQKSDAYQNEPCNSSGLTKCSADGTKVEVCNGSTWQVSSCSTGRCSTATGPARCTTPTPTPAQATCSSGQTRCANGTQVQVCSSGTWQTPTNCASGRTCSSSTGACSTPTPTIMPTGAGTCSSGQTRCSNSTTVQVCSSGTWHNASCPTGCNTGTRLCNTPTPAPVGCFLAGTKVATTDGTKNIEDITPGNKVLSFEEGGKNNVNNSNVSQIYKVTRDYYYKVTANGKTVSVTAEHPFYRGGSEYTNTQDLRVGDIVYQLEGANLVPNTIEAIEKVNEKAEAYNMTVDGDHTYFANSFAVHNKLPPTTGLSKCEQKARKMGLYGANTVGSFNPSLYDLSTVKNLCSSDSLYIGWVWTGYVPPRGAACCVLPSNSNSQTAAFCDGMSGRVTVQFFHDSATQPVDQKSEKVPYTCKTSGVTNTCINTYNYNPIKDRLIASVPNGAHYFAGWSWPSGTAPSCNWLGGSTTSSIKPGFCCP